MKKWTLTEVEELIVAEVDKSAELTKSTGMHWVVFDVALAHEHGIPATLMASALVGLEMEGRKSPIRFYVFDLMQLNGRSLTGLPLAARKEVLAKICDGIGDPIRYSGEIGGDATVLLNEVHRRGLEGLIGKLRDSVYEAGRRSGAWIKLKCVNEQEFVIGGFTPPQGARQHFGAVLVGYYDKKKFLFAGKVGTGFNTKSLASLHKKLKAGQRDDCRARVDGWQARQLRAAGARRLDDR